MKIAWKLSFFFPVCVNSHKNVCAAISRVQYHSLIPLFRRLLIFQFSLLCVNPMGIKFLHFRRISQKKLVFCFVKFFCFKIIKINFNVRFSNWISVLLNWFTIKGKCYISATCFWKLIIYLMRDKSLNFWFLKWPKIFQQNPLKRYIILK